MMEMFEMLALGLFVYLFITVSSMIARGLYYSARVFQIAKEIDSLAVRYEATHNVAVSYLEAGDIEVYEVLDQKLKFYEERIEDLEKEIWVYVEKSRAKTW